jgi:tetrapyrrole methylase family protein/MazG family protein
MPSTASFNTLLDIMRRLRSPQGCPWDREQNHESLKRYLIEEAYEVIEAIDEGSAEKLREELGDLLLQPVFHAVIAEETGSFSMDEVLTAICDKLVRRHPHVFGDQVIHTSSEQIENWERIKKDEKKGERKSALAGVPPHLPALLRAQKVTEKAARVGFDWPDIDGVMAKVHEELAELQETLIIGDKKRMEEELGDLLFAVVNVGRFLELDAEGALAQTIGRFISRFNHIEQSLHKQGISLADATLDDMERLWQEAKELAKSKE